MGLGFLTENQINKLRSTLLKRLYSLQDDEYLSLNNVNASVVDIMLFVNNSGEKIIAIPTDKFNKIDLTGISFDGVNLRNVDFTGSIGAVINPQTVYFKSLYETILSGVKINGSFHGVDIRGTNFTGSKGAVINPQTVFAKNLKGTILADTKIIGSFDGVCIKNTNFKGSTGAIINPQTVYDRNLCNTVLTDAEVIESFDDCKYTSFTFYNEMSILEWLEIVRMEEESKIEDLFKSIMDAPKVKVKH